MKLGRLAEVRKQRGLTQAQLAQRAGLTQSDISRIERGSEPLLGRAVRIARALGVPVEEISTEDDDRAASLAAN